MRPKLQALWRFRPQALTLIVLAVAAALIVLANLSFDVAGGEPFLYRSYGWPLIWRRCIARALPMATIGWYYSLVRLVGNVILWLLMLAASGAMCEWLTRRYRPQPRWRLRTMLLAIGIVGLLCAWYVGARDRANVQDAVIAQIDALGGRVWVERHGPQWLSVLGADQFRRYIIGVDAGNRYGHYKDVNEELLEQLTRLPNLQYLLVQVPRLTPRVVDALGEMRGLRLLSIQRDTKLARDEHEMMAACLAAVGRIKNLERLRLQGMYMGRGDLEHLAGLTNLKLLTVGGYWTEYQSGWLKHLPSLPQLESIEFVYVNVADSDLRHLAELPRLKSLVLYNQSTMLTPRFTAVDLSSLACIESLEEVEIDSELVSAAGLDSLLAIKRLNRLHLRGAWYEGDEYAGLSLDDNDRVSVLKSELDGCRRTLSTLRISKPGIVIDSRHPVGWPYDLPIDVLFDYARSPDPDPRWLPGNVPLMTAAERAAFDAGGGWARFDGAGYKGGYIVSP